MLEIRRLPCRAALVPVMEEFDPDRSAWIVSDLRSKFEMQQRLLEKNDGYLETSVLRASDLWKMLLKKARPEIRIVSRDFVRSLVRSFLEEHREQLGKSASSERSLLTAMDRFVGVVFHPRGAELMEEWFEANPASKERWGESYFLARVALGFLRAQNMIIAKWSAAILQGEPDFEKHWDLPLQVDLGSELTGAEAQLFLRLSKRIPVTLYEPAPPWRSEADGVLRPYRDIEGSALKVSTVPFSGNRPGTLRLSRVSGQLAEVKSAVGIVRGWLEAGVPAAEIAVLAPEIEDYWPILKAYLDEEGIPAEKAVTAKLNSFPSVSRWLARLRPRKGDLQTADLELSFYGTEASQGLRHDDFRVLFANLYGEEDLARHRLVREIFEQGPQFERVMDRDGFLLSAAHLWERREPLAPFQKIAREVLQNADVGTRMPLGEWIGYVESIAANQEFTIEPARPGGLLVTNLVSAKASQLRRRVFLGLTEEGLRKAEPNPLPLGDVRRLSDIGFHLDHPDHSGLEFELRWLVESGSEEDVLFTGTTTFDGAIRAPAPLWLKFRRAMDGDVAHGNLDAPAPTRWDLVQSAGPGTWSHERAWDDAKSDSLLRRLRTDLGDLPPEPVLAPALTRLSPSFVRSYLECPFTVAASTLFRFKDLEEVDLDLARSGLGVLSHAVFQAITDADWLSRPSIEDTEIAALIVEQRQKLKLILAEESWWEPLLKRQVRVVREFLRIEKDWKARFPALRLRPSETEWKIWFDPTAGGFHAEESPGRLLITGRIDRLEEDGEGRFVVVDYKAGASNLFDQADWLKENDLQLLFYMWAVERGALANVQGRAVGAFYYVYRDFSRTRGFQIEEEAGRLYPASVRKSKRSADEAAKAALFVELETRIAGVVRDVKRGRWDPAPRKEDICGRCSWTGLCRASHLN